jgi:hypothetical protein
LDVPILLTKASRVKKATVKEPLCKHWCARS